MNLFLRSIPILDEIVILQIGLPGSFPTAAIMRFVSPSVSDRGIIA